MTPCEDAVARAERHVREAEERVARQAALVEALAGTGDERASAEARRLLANFEGTLAVARQHLAVERKMRSKEW
jgi:hypothetical protein